MSGSPESTSTPSLSAISERFPTPCPVPGPHSLIERTMNLATGHWLATFQCHRVYSSSYDNTTSFFFHPHSLQSTRQWTTLSRLHQDYTAPWESQLELISLMSTSARWVYKINMNYRCLNGILLDISGTCRHIWVAQNWKCPRLDWYACFLGNGRMKRLGHMWWETSGMREKGQGTSEGSESEGRRMTTIIERLSSWEMCSVHVCSRERSWRIPPVGHEKFEELRGYNECQVRRSTNCDKRPPTPTTFVWQGIVLSVFSPAIDGWTTFTIAKVKDSQKNRH